MLIQWNIWRFRGVTVRQSDVIVARRRLPGPEAQSEYCVILATVDAVTADDALRAYHASVRP
jgi:hypothetical protein